MMYLYAAYATWSENTDGQETLVQVTGNAAVTIWHGGMNNIILLLMS